MPALRCLAILRVHDVVIRVVEHDSTAITDHTDLLLVTLCGRDYEPSEKPLPVPDHVLLRVATGEGSLLYFQDIWQGKVTTT